MSRNQLLLLVVCLLFSSSGCTGRYGQGGAGWLAGSPTVAPPPTYSLTIPSVARNQPYYNPNQTNAGAATTPMVANAAPGQLNGWIPKSDNLQTATIAPNSGAPGQTQLGPTAFAGGAPTSVIQTASNSALPGSGTSFTDSPNYRTTSIDETQDQTRLPATDATSVRTSHGQSHWSTRSIRPVSATARRSLSGVPTRLCRYARRRWTAGIR